MPIILQKEFKTTQQVTIHGEAFRLESAYRNDDILGYYIPIEDNKCLEIYYDDPAINIKATVYDHSWERIVPCDRQEALKAMHSVFSEIEHRLSHVGC